MNHSKGINLLCMVFNILTYNVVQYNIVILTTDIISYHKLKWLYFSIVERMPVITCNNKKFNVLYGNTSNSEYIKDIVKLSDNVDINISIPDKYYVVIDTYVKFLEGDKIPITSRNHLFLCFQLSTLFADDSYFKHCVQQTLNNWSYMCNMVYNDFIDDLQWSFFVLSPYDFIPKHLLDNELFMTYWNTANQNITIKVNDDNETYYNNVETINKNHQKTIKTYHVVDVSGLSKEVGNGKEVVYYANSNIIMEENHYIDGKQNGEWKTWYDNNQHTLMSEKYYVDGKRNGPFREWYDNDQHTLMRERHYIDGKLNGQIREWYDGDQHILASEGYYVNDIWDGVYKTWYNNDQNILLHESYNSRDGQRNLNRGWYNNNGHTLAYEGYYVNNKQDGVWKRWYDDDQHTLDCEEYYDNGELINTVHHDVN